MSSRLLILDASFCPPTLAHLKMAQIACEQQKPFQLILMHSIQNADKPSSHDLDHRSNLIQLTRDHLQSLDSSIPISCSILSCPRFIDKLDFLIKEYPQMDYYDFIMGWDTLIRFFDHKYYLSQGQSLLEPTLTRFFDLGGCISVAPRIVPGTSMLSLTELQQEITKLVGQNHHWCNHIQILPRWNAQLASISSTRVRNMIQTMGIQDPSLDALILPTIKDYIREHKLYQSSTTL